MHSKMHIGGGGLQSPKGPRTQLTGVWGPNTINVIVFGPMTWVLGPLGKARVSCSGNPNEEAHFLRAMSLLNRLFFETPN